MSDYLSRTFGLTDRLAVVIGGNGALGGAAARALGGAGAAVLIVGRNEGPSARPSTREPARDQPGASAHSSSKWHVETFFDMIAGP